MIGGGHDHAHAGALVADVFDEIPKLCPRQRINAGGGLIQNQQIRVVNQRTAQPQLLFHAAGQFANRTRQKRRQARAAAQLVNAATAFGGIVAEQPAEELQVFLHRQASDKDFCPDPAACRRYAGRHFRDAGRWPCRRPKLRQCLAAPRAHRRAATTSWICQHHPGRSVQPFSPRGISSVMPSNATVFP